jgi:hypothetical protein
MSGGYSIDEEFTPTVQERITDAISRNNSGELMVIIDDYISDHNKAFMIRNIVRKYNDTGDNTLLEIFINVGIIDPNYIHNEYGMSGDELILIAFYRNDMDFIEYLLDNGASIDAVGSYGDTMLHRLIGKNPALIGNFNHDTISMINYLINRGADVNIQGFAQRTPIVIASMMNDKEIIELLLNKGANPAIEDKTGRSALDYGGMVGMTEDEIIDIFRDRTGTEPSFFKGIKEYLKAPVHQYYGKSRKLSKKKRKSHKLPKKKRKSRKLSKKKRKSIKKRKSKLKY